MDVKSCHLTSGRRRRLLGDCSTRSTSLDLQSGRGAPNTPALSTAKRLIRSSRAALEGAGTSMTSSLRITVTV